MSKRAFATEEEKIAAINGLGDDPAKLQELEEIRDIVVGAPAEPDVIPPEGTVADTSETVVDSLKDKPAEGEAAPAAPSPDAAAAEKWEFKKEEIPGGYKTPGEFLKAFNEAQSLITRQTEFIKKNLSDHKPATTQESDALRRLEVAETELAKLRGSAAAPAAPKTTADIGVVQTEIQRIEAMQDELDKKVEEDNDYQFTAEYAKQSRELSRMQTKNITALTGLLNKAREEIGETRSATSEIVASRKQQEESAAIEQVVNSRFKEMTELDIPEFKLTKPAKEVEKEYVDWRDDVALAYYNRPAVSKEEKFAALQQLQVKNPELIQRCQLLKISTEPSVDVNRYIQQCEMIDYQEGWRKDPATGEWTQLLKNDPRTGKQVPLTFPTLKAAIQQKRLEEGYYEKQRDGAFQKGAQTVTQAAQRRDMGAVELDTRSDMGQTVADSAWALKTLRETNEEEAMKEHRKGNNAKLDLINKARKAMELEPIAFD
jgi:hypothetical protein